MNPKSVAAVVVTYNRSRLLLECLGALLRQTRSVDKIVLIDNASSDGTPEVLQKAGYLSHPLIDYLRLPNNTGGAGGFHAGVKRAYEAGYDWIWIMDDDAEPFVDALELLAPSFERDDIAAVANLTVNPDGGAQPEHRGWIDIRGVTSRAHRSIEPHLLVGEMEIEIDFASFVGLAVSRAAVQKIGLPKRELFIKGDDLEYCMRLTSVGPIILVPQSKILHKDGVSAGWEFRERFGRRSNRVPLDKLWLSYFPVRNLTWLRRRECGVVVAAAFSVRQYLRSALGIMLYDSDRWVRLRFYYWALRDAWQDVFDNEKPRRLTQGAAR